ncbi:serine hydrolase FSH [Lasiosphaeria ovina]|uniref:Serine hydrolase FSH n=1 Tax=Lasiosphaeria ovina TaxID=92902 RepID=A0AAE0KFA1_9PEZI|nr:serine hydrolase FSH [Lasiosphaeria ovina]
MRFLCLHGRGTNAKIFEQQTARVLESLRRDHEFVFINGPAPAEATAGSYLLSEMISMNGNVSVEASGSSVAVPWATRDDVRGFWPLHGGGEADFRQLHHELAAFVHAHGPFEGVMGFSEGGGVAASLLLADKGGTLGFKCAVLFCATVPLDFGADGARPVGFFADDAAAAAAAAALEGAVRLPSAHVYAASDAVSPGAGVKTMAFFREEAREQVVHALGHDVPGARSDEGVRETVRAIARTIERSRTS